MFRSANPWQRFSRLEEYVASLLDGSVFMQISANFKNEIGKYQYSALKLIDI